MACVLTGCATEYHVSTAGLDSNPGTRSKPFKTISRAAEVAQPGDTITVHEGIYRERVNPPRGGTSDDKRIVYRAADGEKVVIKGSEVVKGWKKVDNDTWKATNDGIELMKALVKKNSDAHTRSDLDLAIEKFAEVKQGLNV